MRSKFYLQKDTTLEQQIEDTIKQGRKMLIIAQIVETLRKDEFALDRVKLMKEMKKVQDKIRKYKITPKDLPMVVRQKYAAGLAMGG